MVQTRKSITEKRGRSAVQSENCVGQKGQSVALGEQSMGLSEQAIGRGGHSRAKIIVAIVVVIAVLGIGGVAIGYAYNKGVEMGRQQQQVDEAEKLKQLGEAIQEKTETLTKLGDLNTEVPDEVDEENAKSYIEKLEKVVEDIKNSDAQAKVQEYMETWNTFVNAYSEGVDDTIKEAFEQIKTKAGDTAQAITDVYNNVISEKVKQLE